MENKGEKRAARMDNLLAQALRNQFGNNEMIQLLKIVQQMNDDSLSLEVFPEKPPEKKTEISQLEFEERINVFFDFIDEVMPIANNYQLDAFIRLAPEIHRLASHYKGELIEKERSAEKERRNKFG